MIGFFIGCLSKGCLLNSFSVLNCLILVHIGFSKNGNPDNNLGLVSSLILGFIVFPKNGSCFNKFLICEAIIIALTDKKFKKIKLKNYLYLNASLSVIIDDYLFVQIIICN